MLQIPDQKLKEMLVRDGIIKPENFDAIASEAKRMAQSTANILIARNIINNTYFNAIIAEYYGVEKANLSGMQIPDDVIHLLPEDLARQKRVIIFNKREDSSLDVAMEDPNNLEIIDFLTQFLKKKINPFLAGQDDL